MKIDEKIFTKTLLELGLNFKYEVTENILKFFLKKLEQKGFNTEIFLYAAEKIEDENNYFPVIADFVKGKVEYFRELKFQLNILAENEWVDLLGLINRTETDFSGHQEHFFFDLKTDTWIKNQGGFEILTKKIRRMFQLRRDICETEIACLKMRFKAFFQNQTKKQNSKKIVETKKINRQAEGLAKLVDQTAANRRINCGKHV